MKYFVQLMILLLLGGCSSKHYYMLSSPHVIAENTQVQKVIGVESIAVPAYFKNGKIAIQKENNEIIYLDNAFWAVDMGEDLTSAFIFDLQKSLQNAKIMHYPWDVSQTPDIKIAVKIKRFIAKEGNVYLDAVIRLNDQSHVVSFQVPVDMGDDAKIVAGMKKAFFLLESAVVDLIDDISVSQ